MIIANNKMYRLLRTTQYKNKRLPRKLQEILDEGLIKKNDCVFLRYYYEPNSRHIKAENFSDNIGYENFINGFHSPYRRLF